MPTEIEVGQTLILGIGNSLLSDDGVGVHVVRSLQAGELPSGVAVCEGGTVGLALLAQIEQFGSLIAVDAMELGLEAGAVQVFEGPMMDRQLTGPKRTAHEVALSDLISAAHLAGTAPPQRALVAVQPASTQWGLSPTEAVGAAVPRACAAVLAIAARWRDGG